MACLVDNYISGEIPVSIESLKELEVLDMGECSMCCGKTQLHSKRLDLHILINTFQSLQLSCRSSN